MKKFLIAIMILLLSMCVIFVACDNESNNPMPPQEEDKPAQGDKWGDAEWKPLNKYEWEDLFSTTKFVNAKFEISYADRTDVIIIDGFKVAYTVRGVNYFEHFHDGKITTYNYINNIWYSSTTSNGLNARSQYDSVNTILSIYKQNYASLIYKKGEYVADKLFGYNDAFIKIKVVLNVENKLEFFETSATENITNLSVSGKISYGGHKVDLPPAIPV